ncbi:hypothetical protein ACFQ46_18125 [Kineococcus sp. GCM10028916]|uniref:hypothetical protein n=1 Tax=Kineococcus sp. GCM10028916 TaxID=3273394 RepID=UPI003638D32A
MTHPAPSQLPSDAASVPCPQRSTHRRRRSALLVLAVGGVSLVGAGTLASWQATSTATSGTVTAALAAVDLVDANGSAFHAVMPDLLPGDYWYRYVDLTNQGTTAGSYSGAITATGDLSGALAVTVERCSMAWTSTGDCLGAKTTPLAGEVAVNETGVSVSYASIAPGAVGAAHVRYRFKLKDDAPQTLMGKNGTIAISVSGQTTGGRDRTMP